MSARRRLRRILRAGSGTPSIWVLPLLAALNFTLADLAGGDSITITGSNLATATSCTVGGTAATITANTATSLTFTMPAKAAAVYSVLVTTALGTSNALSIEAFNPTVLANLTGWWKASYPGTPPWPGQVSSPTRDLVTNVVGREPAAGALVNGFAPMVTKSGGTPKSLELATTFDALIGTFPNILETGWALLQLDAVPADPGAGSRDGAAAIYLAAAANMGTTVFGAGGNASMCHFLNNGTSIVEATVAIGGTGSYQFVEWGYDGTNLWVKKSNGARVNVAQTTTSGQPSPQSRTPSIGGNPGVYLDAHVLEVGFYHQDQLDSDLDKIRRYLMCRYPALGVL